MSNCCLLNQLIQKAGKAGREKMDEVVKPCKYILNEEVCPYGSKCRFGHGSLENESRVADMKRDKTLTTETSQNKPPPHKERQNLRQKNCYFYLHSHCRYGNKCKFSHPRRSGFQKNKAADIDIQTADIDIQTAGIVGPLPVPTEVAPDQVNTPLEKATVYQNDLATKGTSNIRRRDPEITTGKIPATGKTQIKHQAPVSREKAELEPRDSQSTAGSAEKERITTRPKAEYRPTESKSHRNAYAKEKTSGRTKKTEDYQSQSGAPPPLTLESFLTKQPVKRPQRASSRQNEAASKGSVREVRLVCAS